MCERVVDIVFRGASPDRHHVESGLSGGKRTLLIYLGSLASMGITASALNLLKNLDYDRFDVSAFYQHTGDRDRLKNAQLIDPRGAGVPPASARSPPPGTGSPRRSG